MAEKLPPEEELAPSHELGGEPTDDDVDAPELDDYDTEPEYDDGDAVELDDVAIPEEEDDDVEDELDELDGVSSEW